MSNYCPNGYCTLVWKFPTFSRQHLKRKNKALDESFVIEIGQKKFFCKINIVKSDLSFFIAQLESKHLKTDRFSIKYGCSAQDLMGSNYLLKVSDGLMCSLGSKECDCYAGALGFDVNLDDLLDPRCPILSTGTLKLIFYFQFHFVGEKKDDPYPQGYAQYFNEAQQFIDLELICNNKIIQVHKAIIFATASPLFCRMIQKKIVPGKSGKLDRVFLDEKDENVMYEFVRFLYTGSSHNLTTNAWDLWELSEKYELLPLKRMCIDYISFSMSFKNVLQTFQLAFHFKNKTLKNNCIGLIKMLKRFIVDLDEWKNFDPMLLSIIANSEMKRPHLCKVLGGD